MKYGNGQYLWPFAIKSGWSRADGPNTLLKESSGASMTFSSSNINFLTASPCFTVPRLESLWSQMFSMGTMAQSLPMGRQRSLLKILIPQDCFPKNGHFEPEPCWNSTSSPCQSSGKTYSMYGFALSTVQQLLCRNWSRCGLPHPYVHLMPWSLVASQTLSVWAFSGGVLSAEYPPSFHGVGA